MINKKLSTNLKQLVQLEMSNDGVAQLIINRPAVHNAFDSDVIEQLISNLEVTNEDPRVRTLVLRSQGKHFSAGADLAWMKRMAQNSYEENIVDANRLARLMEVLNNHSKPTIALVQGAAYGGAVGLLACCDIVIATENSSFCLSEVRIGLIPAVISPYVVRAISERQSRRYFITAELFDSRTAQELGLVHEIVKSTEQLDEACDSFTSTLSKNSPQAMKAAKELIYTISQKEITKEVIDDTARRIADIRISEEGQEGLGSFLQKRKPNWIQE